MSKKQAEYIRLLRARALEFSSPTVIYQGLRFGTYPLVVGCIDLDVQVDCYFSTAVVSIHGVWTASEAKGYIKMDDKKHDDDGKTTFVFILNKRGSVTECNVRVSTNSKTDFVQTMQ